MDYTPSRSSQDGNPSLGTSHSMVSLAETAVHSDYDQPTRDEDESLTEPDESDGSAGVGSYQDDSRIPSLSTSVATLATIDCAYTPSPAVDLQLPPFPEPWTYPLSTDVMPMFDLTVPLPATDAHSTDALTNVDFSDIPFADLIASISPQPNTSAAPSWQAFFESTLPPQPTFPFSPVTAPSAPAQLPTKAPVLHVAPEIVNDRPTKRAKHGPTPGPSRTSPPTISRAATSPRSRTSPQQRVSTGKRSPSNSHRIPHPTPQRAIPIAPRPQPETSVASTSLRPIKPMPAPTINPSHLSNGRAIKSMPSSKGRLAPLPPSGDHPGLPQPTMVHM